MAILEAMASATAVLISPGCCFDGVVAAGAGVIAEPSETALNAALSSLLEDSTRLRAMGVAARQMVERDYRWDDIAASMDRLYSEVVAGSRRVV